MKKWLYIAGIALMACLGTQRSEAAVSAILSFQNNDWNTGPDNVDYTFKAQQFSGSQPLWVIYRYDLENGELKGTTYHYNNSSATITISDDFFYVVRFYTGGIYGYIDGSATGYTKACFKANIWVPPSSWVSEIGDEPDEGNYWTDYVIFGSSWGDMLVGNMGGGPYYVSPPDPNTYWK